MRATATIFYLLASVVNLLPGLGVLSAARLEKFYGIAIREPNLEILMRHRAVLFTIVGVLLITAAFRVSLRPVAATAGLVSMLSFVVIALVVGGYDAKIQRVVLVDVVASVLLVTAMLLDRWSGGGVDG